LSALLLIDKPWFLTEGKDLLLCSSYFPLGVSQLLAIIINYTPDITFSLCRPRGRFSSSEFCKEARARAINPNPLSPLFLRKSLPHRRTDLTLPLILPRDVRAEPPVCPEVDLATAVV
jgi:hypothetical protein